MILTGVLDGPLPGGLPKAIEIYVINDIPDISTYGIESQMGLLQLAYQSLLFLRKLLLQAYYPSTEEPLFTQ